MNTIVFVAVITIALIPTVTSLRCHSCISETSQLDCHQHKKNEDCRPNEKCGIGSYRIADVHFYVKKCTPVAECDVVTYCKTRDDKFDCKIDCCTGDLCNSGTRRRISIFMTIASLLLTLFLHW